MFLKHNTAIISPVEHICPWSSTYSSTLWYWSETSMGASQAEGVKCGVSVERKRDREQINDINISCSCHLGVKPSCIFMSVRHRDHKGWELLTLLTSGSQLKTRTHTMIHTFIKYSWAPAAPVYTHMLTLLRRIVRIVGGEKCNELQQD